MTRQRGQLVLLAAVALAIALVPMALAHLQLGYHEDVQTATIDDSRLGDSVRALHRALDGAIQGIPAQYSWSDRQRAVTIVRDRLRPTVRNLNTSRLDEHVVAGITYNGTKAREWARMQCPQGPDRQFGPCLTDRGIVVQERAGETHILALAVDIRVTGDRTEWQVVTVVRANTRPE